LVFLLLCALFFLVLTNEAAMNNEASSETLKSLNTVREMEEVISLNAGEI
jgi:hypothetical protein